MQRVLLEAAIDWLCEVVQGRGDDNDMPRRLTSAEQAVTVGVLHEINQAIHPRRLPADIEWFWSTWNADSFRAVTPHPRLTSPDFALESWVDQPEWPRALFWVAYESHCFLSVELDFPDSTGPMLFADCYASGSGLELVAPNLATWLSGCAAAIEASPELSLQELWQTTGTDQVHRTCAEALSVQSIAPSERGPFDWYDLLACPPRWQVQQGIDAASIVLRGATCTIAELQQARRQGPVEATIVGHMRASAGSGAGQLVTVDDDTGRAVVWIPTTVPTPGNSETEIFEIDVVAEQSVAPESGFDDMGNDHSEINRRALSGDMSGAAEVGKRIGDFLHGQHPIVAQAVRPVSS